MKEKVEAGKVVAKTHKRFEITKDKVFAFMKYKFHLSDKPIDEIRLAYVTEFDHYLSTPHNLCFNTAMKYIKNLKKIMNEAVAMDWISTNPFQTFNAHTQILIEKFKFSKSWTRSMKKNFL